MVAPVERAKAKTKSKKAKSKKKTSSHGGWGRPSCDESLGWHRSPRV
jgi:hypothetical protein